MSRHLPFVSSKDNDEEDHDMLATTLDGAPSLARRLEASQQRQRQVLLAIADKERQLASLTLRSATQKQQDDDHDDDDPHDPIAALATSALASTSAAAAASTAAMVLGQRQMAPLPSLAGTDTVASALQSSQHAIFEQQAALRQEELSAQLKEARARSKTARRMEQNLRSHIASLRDQALAAEQKATIHIGDLEAKLSSCRAEVARQQVQQQSTDTQLDATQRALADAKTQLHHTTRKYETVANRHEEILADMRSELTAAGEAVARSREREAAATASLEAARRDCEAQEARAREAVSKARSTSALNDVLSRDLAAARSQSERLRGQQRARGELEERHKQATATIVALRAELTKARSAADKVNPLMHANESLQAESTRLRRANEALTHHLTELREQHLTLQRNYEGTVRDYDTLRTSAAGAEREGRMATQRHAVLEDAMLTRARALLSVVSKCMHAARHGETMEIAAEMAAAATAGAEHVSGPLTSVMEALWRAATGTAKQLTQTSAAHADAARKVTQLRRLVAANEAELTALRGAREDAKDARSALEHADASFSQERAHMVRQLRDTEDRARIALSSVEDLVAKVSRACQVVRAQAVTEMNDDAVRDALARSKASPPPVPDMKHGDWDRALRDMTAYAEEALEWTTHRVDGQAADLATLRDRVRVLEHAHDGYETAIAERDGALKEQRKRAHEEAEQLRSALDASQATAMRLAITIQTLRNDMTLMFRALRPTLTRMHDLVMQKRLLTESLMAALNDIDRVALLVRGDATRPRRRLRAAILAVLAAQRLTRLGAPRQGTRWPTGRALRVGDDTVFLLPASAVSEAAQDLSYYPAAGGVATREVEPAADRTMQLLYFFDANGDQRDAAAPVSASPSLLARITRRRGSDTLVLAVRDVLARVRDESEWYRLETQRDHAAHQNHALTAELDASSVQLSDAQRHIQALTERISAVGSVKERSILQKEHKETQEKLQSAVGEVERTRARLEEMGGALKVARQEVQSRERQLADARAADAARGSEVDALRVFLQTKSSHLAAAERDAKLISEELERTKSELRESLLQVQQAKVQCRTMESAYDESQRLSHRLRSELSLLRTRSAHLEDEKSHLYVAVQQRDADLLRSRDALVAISESRRLHLQDQDSMDQENEPHLENERGKSEEWCRPPANTPESIIEYWYGRSWDQVVAGDPVEVHDQMAAHWWSVDAALDTERRERFTATLESVARREQDHWLATIEGRLAAVIVLDSLARSMFRGTPRAYAYDELAQLLAQNAIDMGADETLPLLGRVMLYMPLMHAERNDIQERSLTAFRRLLESVDGVRDAEGRPDNQQRVLVARFCDFAQRHADHIAKFGRFQHRNAILQRRMTVVEVGSMNDQGTPETPLVMRHP